MAETTERTTMTKPLCIYHGHCDDGFAAGMCGV
jgi:hypothetical protein